MEFRRLLFRSNDRLQAAAEDLAEVALERADRIWDVRHAFIMADEWGWWLAAVAPWLVTDNYPCTIRGDAASAAERRVCWRPRRAAELARRAQVESLAARQRRRHHVRQRRQLGAAARRAWRPPARRHSEMRAGAVAQRARGAARAADAAADARGRAPGRPHRRQPAAVDDAKLQRRFPGRDRRPARVAWMPRPRVAGERSAGVGVRGVRRRVRYARGSRGGRGADLGTIRPAHL